MEIMQSLVLGCIEVLCLRIFMDTFFERKYEQYDWRMKLYVPIQVVLCLAVNALLKPYVLFRIICIILIYSLLSFACYVSRFVYLLIMSFACFAIDAGIDMLVYAFVDKLLYSRYSAWIDNGIGSTVVAALSKLLLFLFMLFINHFFSKSKNISMVPKRQWLFILYFGGVTVLTDLLYFTHQEFAFYMVVFWGGIISNLVVYYMIRDNMNREGELYEKRRLEQEAKNQIELYRNREESFLNQRKLMHEYKNHLDAIQGAMEQQQYQKALSYIKSINQQWQVETGLVDVEHVMVNSILNQEISRAKKEDILLVLRVGNMADLWLEDEDIVILLSNLLNNAIEACKEVELGRRKIYFCMHLRQEYLEISVENTMSPTDNVDITQPLKTRKRQSELHGIGLKNIQTIVQKYGGEDIMDVGENMFVHTVLLEKN